MSHDSFFQQFVQQRRAVAQMIVNHGQIDGRGPIRAIGPAHRDPGLRDTQR